MRGPLLSGTVGSAATLRRLSQVLGAYPPTVVMNSPWLGLSLATEVSLIALLPRSALAAARRRRRRRGPELRASVFALAGPAFPLAPGSAGSVVVADLAELVAANLVALLLEVAPLVRQGGILVGLDRTKDHATESRVAGAFLGAGYLGLTQDRPREGALLTQAHPPPPAVRTVLTEALRRSGE